MEREEIVSSDAPSAIGPYSQGIRAGGFIFLSGQIPVDPGSGEVVAGGIGPQTRQVLKNIEALLKAAGSRPGLVVKTTVYLKNLSDFQEMNEVYGGFFKPPYPARATVEVSALPKGVEIEMDVIALRGG